MISFICCSRNDGYCNNNDDVVVHGIEDFNADRIKSFVYSISLLPFPDKELIFVECFPPDDKPRIESLISNFPFVKIITISNNVRDILYNQTPYRMPLYEYLGKHIGSLVAKNDRLLFTNCDDLFVQEDIKRTCTLIDNRTIVRAHRYDINEMVVTDPKLIQDISKGIDPITIGYSPNAGGDYLGISKEIYNLIHGYRLCHGEWDVDNQLLQTAEMNNIHIDYNAKHYHIRHYQNKDSHCMTPNRPPRVPAIEHKPIDNIDNIIKEVLCQNNLR